MRLPTYLELTGKIRRPPDSRCVTSSVPGSSLLPQDMAASSRGMRDRLPGFDPMLSPSDDPMRPKRRRRGEASTHSSLDVRTDTRS